MTPAELKLPRQIELIRAIPAQLRFTFERRATRDVPVEVRFSGKLPKGLSITITDVEPPDLKIAGPESRVLALKTLISDPFDLTNVTADAERKLAVYAAEAEIRILKAPQVTVKIRVQPSR